MAFIGNQPTAVPLTSSQLADGLITTAKLAADAVTSAKIADSTIVNADIASTTINLTQKVTGTLPATNGGTGVASYSAGNILYATNATTLATLAPGTSGHALTLNGTTPTWSAVGAAAGQVIQVVSATDTTKRTTTSTSFVTGSNTLTGVITPSATANKIIVAVVTYASVTDDPQYFLGSVYRTISGTTVNLANDTSDTGGGYGFIAGRQNYTILIYDSPNTTSEITYQFRFRTNNASYTASFNESINTVGGTPTTRSIILCMEVKQ